MSLRRPVDGESLVLRYVPCILLGHSEMVAMALRCACPMPCQQMDITIDSSVVKARRRIFAKTLFKVHSNDMICCADC